MLGQEGSQQFLHLQMTALYVVPPIWSPAHHPTLPLTCPKSRLPTNQDPEPASPGMENTDVLFSPPPIYYFVIHSMPGSPLGLCLPCNCHYYRSSRLKFASLLYFCFPAVGTPLLLEAMWISLREGSNLESTGKESSRYYQSTPRQRKNDWKAA